MQGIRDQNGDWEGVLAEENPEATRLAPTAKTFDLHNKNSGEAISAKTMNIQSYGYSNNPQRIYYRLKGYVDATANYRPRTSLDINPDLIRSRTIQLAIPEYVAPKQWRYLYRAIRYGRERGVRLVVTRISD